MKLEDQVCSLEQAKKLVELGVVLDTAWYWYKAWNDLDYTLYQKSQISSVLNDAFPAPNVAELGVVLPYEIRIDANKSHHLEIWKTHNGWQYRYFGLFFPDKKARTEAQARAEALIWLIENDYVKVEDLKLWS